LAACADLLRRAGRSSGIAGDGDSLELDQAAGSGARRQAYSGRGYHLGDADLLIRELEGIKAFAIS
jgi:hypothetical protein